MLFSTTTLAAKLLPGASGDKKAIDKHHIFPKNYLTGIGYTSDRDRNQIANFTYLDYNTKVNAMVENEAQKEFMRYAFLENPKTALGRLGSGAWRKFREWWDEHKREAVEKKTRESVLAKLNEHKKEIAEEPRRKLFHSKQRGSELE